MSSISVSMWLAIVAMCLGTYLMRSVPLVLSSRMSLPEPIRRWLSFVTPAVLGALLGPALLQPGGVWTIPWENPTLLAAFPTVLVAWRWRNHLLTIVCGVLSFALADQFI